MLRKLPCDKGFTISPAFQVPSLLEDCAEDGSSSSDEEEDDEDEHGSGEDDTQERGGQDQTQPLDKKVPSLFSNISSVKKKVLYNEMFLFSSSGKKEDGKRSSEGEAKK